MKQLYTTLIILFSVFTVHAQWSQLTDQNLSTIENNGIVYSGTAVVIISEGGVFRSTDNGDTWSMAVEGLDTINIGARDIAFVGARNEIWLSANNKLYKSTDHALTWSYVSLNSITENYWIDDIAVVNGRLVLYFSYFDTDESAHVSRLVYSDNGTDWNTGQLLSIDNDSWWDMIYDDNDRAVFMVEYPNDKDTALLWYSTDGTTIQEFPVTGLGTDPDINSRNFSMDPSGDILFFTDENAGKYYRYDFTLSTWEEKMNGISAVDMALAMTFKAHSLGDRLFATALFSNASSELVMKLFTSVDDGDSWTEVTDPGIEYPVFDDKIIIAGSGRLIASHFSSTLIFSDDNGATWDRNYEIFAGSFSNLAGLDNGKLFTTTSDPLRGLLRSDDNGDTWTLFPGDLPDFQGLLFVDRLGSAGNWLYGIVFEDPNNEIPSLYLSKNDGVNWTKIETAPESKNIEFVGKNRLFPVFEFTDDSDNITFQMTKDGGGTWIDLTPGINTLSVDRVLGFKGNGTLGQLILFAEKAGKTRIYMSENDGDSYTDITLNLDGFSYEILIGNRWNWNTYTNPIADYNANGSTIFVGAWDQSEFTHKVRFFSLNETKDAWIPAGTEGLVFPHDINWQSLTFLGGVWYFVTPAGIFASIDECISWLPIWNNEGMVSGLFPESFVVNGYGAFLGTEGAGIWRAPLAAPTITTLSATAITDTSAVSGATISSTGGLPFGGKGLCWSTSPSPTVADKMLAKDNTWKSFTDTLKMLIPNTDYYVRAFVNSPKGMGQPVYGNEITFKTDHITSKIAGEEQTMNIYPNPASGYFNIDTDREWKIAIMNILGKVVYEGPVKEGITTISVSAEPPGVYLIRMTDKSGEIRMTRLTVE